MSLMSFVEFLAMLSASLVLSAASYQYGKLIGSWDGYEHGFLEGYKYVLTLLGSERGRY